jgi:hypothetical protein
VNPKKKLKIGKERQEQQKEEGKSCNEEFFLE